MRSSHPRVSNRSRAAAVALCGLLIAGLAAIAGPALASSHSGMSMSGAMGDQVGNTKGWFHGKTVTFHYTKDFFCKEPPHSKAKSHCELGADFKRKPSND